MDEFWLLATGRESLGLFEPQSSPELRKLNLSTLITAFLVISKCLSVCLAVGISQAWMLPNSSSFFPLKLMSIVGGCCSSVFGVLGCKLGVEEIDHSQQANFSCVYRARLHALKRRKAQ